MLSKFAADVAAIDLAETELSCLSITAKVHLLTLFYYFGFCPPPFVFIIIIILC